MGAAGQPPIITHTAATPQDSPNTTLDVGYRDLNCRAVYPTAALSIESIDRSGVRVLSFKQLSCLTRCSYRDKV